MTNLLDFFNSTKMIKVSGLPSRPDQVIVPVEVDGGLYISYMVDATSVAGQHFFRDSVNVYDQIVNTGGYSSCLARLTPDLEPWWIAKINPSTETTTNRIVWITDIVSLADDGGAVVIGTFYSPRNTPTSPAVFSLNFIDPDGSTAFNLPKHNQSAYETFYAKISAAGSWEWVKSIWEDTFSTASDTGVMGQRAGLMADGTVYLAGTFRLIDLTTARVYFDDTTYFTGINLASSVNAATYGFVAWIDSTDGSLIAHQVDSAEADVASPNGVYMWQRNNSGTLLNGLTTNDYAQTIRDFGGGVSPYASTAGVMHFAAKYGSATTTADLLLDYGNTDLFMPNASSSGNQSGLLAARTMSGVDWASALIEPNRTGATVNDKVFCAVWTFEDGSCIALGKGLMNNAASQNAQIERFPSSITPVPIVSDLPYGVAVRYDVDGNVVWTAKFIEYGAVFGPTLGGGGWFNLYDCWYDEQRDLLHFTLSQAVTTSLTINPDTTPVVLSTSPAAEKGFVLSMDPNTGEITHADNILTAANGSCYPCRVITNPVTGMCYVGIDNKSTTASSTNLFPNSDDPLPILDLNNNGALHLAEFEPTESPVTPTTNPYTPTRVVEVVNINVITPNFRAVKPITTTTVYDRATQYYDFYSRRVAAAGGTISDPVATLAFIEFCVEEGIWTKLSAAFLPFAGLTTGGGGEVTTWFNLHGADVAEAGAARPIWTASDANFNSLPSVDFNGTAQRLLATVAAVNLSRTALFSESEYEIFSVFRADAINTAGALSSSMDQLIYCGIAGLGLNSTPTAGVWSNDGAVDSASNAISLSATYLISGRHEGGSIYSAINAGGETSAVSGNVGLTTLQLYLGNNASTAWFDGQMSAAIICRSALTTGQRTALKTYLMELYALA